MKPSICQSVLSDSRMRLQVKVKAFPRLFQDFSKLQPLLGSRGAGGRVCSVQEYQFLHFLATLIPFQIPALVCPNPALFYGAVSFTVSMKFLCAGTVSVVM